MIDPVVHQNTQGDKTLEFRYNGGFISVIETCNRPAKGRVFERGVIGFTREQLALFVEDLVDFVDEIEAENG